MALAVLAGRPRRAGAKPRTAGSQPVFAYPIQKTVLDNGLTVLSVPFDSPGIIAYYTVVRTGSRNEVEKGLSGFAHFFEHMMFRGTEAFPQEKYNDVLKSLGADSNAFTNDDWTCYHMTIPATALATAVEIEADRFQNLKYDEPSFQKEARAVLGEYNKSASSPFLKLERDDAEHGLHDAHLQAHDDRLPGRHQGHAQPVRLQQGLFRPLVPARELHDHRGGGREARRPGGAGQAVLRRLEAGQGAGRDPHRAAADGAESSAADLAAADPAHALPGLSHSGRRPRQSRHGRLGRARAGASSARPARSTRSWCSRNKRSSTMKAEAEPKRDPGLFTILVRVRKPEDLPIVRARIAAALAEAAKTPIDSARLDAIKSHLRYEFAGSLRTADAVANAVGTAVAITGRPESINELYDAYDRLTPADLQRVAARYFQPANETAIILETEMKK